jgi:[methyl-Co(III) methanol-specific corrinoid protein]:coenzyme M methyltransferase
VEILKKEVGDEVAIVAGIIGPFTIAGSLLDSVPLLKATFKAPEKMRPFLDVGEKAGTALAKALIDAGADIISIEDMTASPELIAPKTYRDYELEYQRKQCDAISVPKILHICGNVDPIIAWMGQTGAEILSLEPKASAKLAREKCGADAILMGGVDTATTLFMKDPETVKEGCEESVADGIQILAPGCAVAPGTPTENLLAMVEIAKAH